MTDMTWNDLAATKYLSAADVAGKRIAVTIKAIRMETMNDGKEKPVVHFEELSKGCVLNATRRKFLASLCKSPNVRDAIGQRLVLCEGVTQFQGEECACIKFAVTKAAMKKEVQEELNDELPDFA